MNDAVMFFLVYAFAAAVIVGIVRVTRPRVETGSASRVDELESWHARYDAELAKTGSEPAALLAADRPPPLDLSAVRMMAEAVRDGSRPYVVLPSENVTFECVAGVPIIRYGESVWG